MEELVLIGLHNDERILIKNFNAMNTFLHTLTNSFDNQQMKWNGLREINQMIVVNLAEISALNLSNMPWAFSKLVNVA